MDYFQKPLTVSIVLGSFFVITLPLTGLALFGERDSLSSVIFLCQAIILGATHFVITGALYLQHGNLEHFSSSGKNKLIYFVAPAAILIVYAFSVSAPLAGTFPVAVTAFHTAIRIFDFTHVARQSFGVLQIFKRTTGGVMPGWTRRAEDVLFVGMAFLQMATFVSGGSFDPDNPYLLGGALAALGLFAALVLAYLRSLLQTHERRDLCVALAYLVFQVVSAALVVFRTELYVIALTMHYVEYHVIMAPRCFGVSLDPRRRIDRLFDLLRRNKFVFYYLLLSIAALWRLAPLLDSFLQAGWTGFPLRFLVHIFDGLFLVHFFVESFVWKFSKPYYRETLSPLYFASARRGAAG